MTIARPQVRDAIPGNASAPEIPIWGLLVWAYRDEAVRSTFGSDEGASVLRELSGTGAAIRALKLGGTFRAQPGEGPYFSAFCHRDALIVHAAVTELSKADEWLIVRTAEAAEPPDWDPDVPEIDRFAAYYDEFTGEVVEKFLWCKVARRRVPGTWHCPIRPVPENGRSESEKEAIRADARALYTRWTEVLGQLRASLSVFEPGLTRWRLSDFVPDPEPWRDQAKTPGLTTASKT